MSQEKKSGDAARMEREAQKAFRKADAAQALTEHEQNEKAFGNNRERLRAERISREAAAGPMLAPTPELPDDTTIERVILSTRIQNAFRQPGLKTVGEVREATDETLLSLPDLGRSSLAELRNKLGLPSTHGVRTVSKKTD